jgi:hypothetical protein
MAGEKAEPGGESMRDFFRNSNWGKEGAGEFSANWEASTFYAGMIFDRSQTDFFERI